MWDYASHDGVFIKDKIQFAWKTIPSQSNRWALTTKFPLLSCWKVPWTNFWEDCLWLLEIWVRSFRLVIEEDPWVNWTPNWETVVVTVSQSTQRDALFYYGSNLEKQGSLQWTDLLEESWACGWRGQVGGCSPFWRVWFQLLFLSL